MLGFSNIFGPNHVVTTPAAGDSSNRVADTQFVATAIASSIASTLASAFLGTTGSFLQLQYGELTSLLNSSSTMAGAADTVPAITDGTQIVSVTITPASTGSNLFVQAIAPVSSSAAGPNMWMAVFQDAVSAAKAATVFATITQNAIVDATMNFRIVSGTTGPTTFQMRVGNFNGNVVTWAVNGIANTPTRRLGGSSRATLAVTEIHG